MKQLNEKQTQEVQEVQQTPSFSSSFKRDLRYILTQKCNYNCSFCHKEGCDGSEKELLNSDDYLYLFTTAKDALGINQVSLSGGEPMLCKNLGPINEQLKTHNAYITMVSNGSLLSLNKEALKDIDVLNISLHTTNQDFFNTLTGSSIQVEDVIEEIITIQQQYPHIQIKINSAIIQDQNLPGSKDFTKKIELAKKYGWKLKYLELSDDNLPGFVSVRTFENMLLSLGFIKDHSNARQNSYHKDGVEIITGRVFCSQAKETDNPQGYCKQFNDLYITPDGYISACPIDIKKHSAYDAIVTRNTEQLSNMLQQTIADSTKYACPFSS